MSATRHSRGFTLIEIMVVITISVGLVLTIATLFRSAGQTMVSLRGLSKEWNLQQRLRTQLSMLLFNADMGYRGLQSQNDTLYLTTWYSNQNGVDGKPVLAVYRFNASDRRIEYQEYPLPPWWEPRYRMQQGQTPDLGQLQATLRPADSSQDKPQNLSGGIHGFRVRYYDPDQRLSNPSAWKDQWRDYNAIPTLINIEIDRADTTLQFLVEPQAINS